MIRLILVMFAMMFLLGGCAHVMSEANLKLADRSIRYDELRANPEAFAGRTVLVGGIIAGVNSSGDVSMLEVSQLELLRNGVPDEDSRSGGRFLVVSGELIDPVIYRPGQLVTVIGEVKGKRVQKLDNVEYPCPLISMREMRMFRSSADSPVPFPSTANPYQSQFGDEKFLGRPPGLADGEPRKPY